MTPGSPSATFDQSLDSLYALLFAVPLVLLVAGCLLAVVDVVRGGRIGALDRAVSDARAALVTAGTTTAEADPRSRAAGLAVGRSHAADTAIVDALRRRMVHRDPTVFPATPLPRVWLDGTGACWIAVDGARPVGMILVAVDRTGRATLAAHWVDEPWRGRGLGSALLAQALGWSDRIGAPGVGAWVQDGSPAGDLYRRHDLAPTGTTHRHGPAPVERWWSRTPDLVRRSSAGRAPGPAGSERSGTPISARDGPAGRGART